VLRQDLLQNELDNYKTNEKIELKPLKYNRNKFFDLFKKYKRWGMTEQSYCCYGEEQCCWYDPYEEGIWNLSLHQIRKIILNDIKSLQYIIRSIRKYGHRMYVYQDKNRCYIYIYCRDVFQRDYHIWFSNNIND
jgi:hypothetical protein